MIRRPGQLWMVVGDIAADECEFYLTLSRETRDHLVFWKVLQIVSFKKPCVRYWLERTMENDTLLADSINDEKSD